MRLISLSFVILCLFAGCGASHHSHRQAERMLFSPNGEPLNGGPLGRPTCKTALSTWFKRVDSNSDGIITEDEFLIDAKVQFIRMDIDRNGYLVAEEVDRFRLPYQPSDESALAYDDNSSSSGMEGRGGAHGGKSRRPSSDNAGSDEADPVMSADINNDFKVTSEEFMSHATRVFAKLKSDGKTGLELEDVLHACDQPKPSTTD